MTPSGRFVLRIPPELHTALRQAAEQAGVSLNAHCAERLATPAAVAGGPGPPVAARALEILGGAPVGAVAFGSWARGEAGADSDIDVAVIVDRDTGIDRDLYRRWDAEELDWEGRRVDAHFAHPPASDEEISALWADLALDGLVLFDSDLRIARLLGSLRRRLLEGREVERKEVHGQPYWVRVS